MTEDQEMRSPRTENCLTFRCSSLVLVVALGSLATLVRAEPDEGVLGKAQGYPVGTNISNWQETPYRVGSGMVVNQDHHGRAARPKRSIQTLAPAAIPITAATSAIVSDTSEPTWS